MAFFQMNFFSETLGFHTDVCVVIPTPDTVELINNQDLDYFQDGMKYQTLYLLHGAYGESTDWIRFTGIEDYAQTRKLAVVMPAAANSFYQDMYRGSAYLTYLSEELPKYMQKLFPITKKREHTFTAGLSMGGYGALRLGFEKPEQYSACASISGAVDITDSYDRIQAGKQTGPFQWKDIFEGESPEGTDNDLFVLIEKRKKEGRKLPKVFQSCGTEDFIYQSNKGAKRKLEAAGIELTYEEHPGIHNWKYWDTHIQRVLDWLPLENGPIREEASYGTH